MSESCIVCPGRLTLGLYAQMPYRRADFVVEATRLLRAVSRSTLGSLSAFTQTRRPAIRPAPGTETRGGAEETNEDRYIRRR